jgi:dTDP-glucose 4,6-dehydratase
MIKGDVQDFAFPGGGFDYIAHFGSTGSRRFHDEQPLAFFDLVVSGTRRVLDLAVAAKASRFLLASSGAIYGRTAPGPIKEEDAGALDSLSPGSANAEAKRVAEFLCACVSRARPSLAAVSARGFSFVGPYLPAEAKFAAYEFIQDSIAGREITVSGDGTPVRSFLYGSDLAVWLWTLLLRAPANSAYNVGSETPVTIRELADKVAAAGTGLRRVRVEGVPAVGFAPNWYVPSTEKARRDLGLRMAIPLDEAIRRTATWYGSQASPS